MFCFVPKELHIYGEGRENAERKDNENEKEQTKKHKSTIDHSVLIQTKQRSLSKKKKGFFNSREDLASIFGESTLIKKHIKAK